MKVHPLDVRRAALIWKEPSANVRRQVSQQPRPTENVGGGRKRGTGLKADPARVRELRSRGLTNREIAAALGVSTRTVIRRVERE